MKKSFTLIELVISIALLSVLAGAGAWVLVVGVKAWVSDQDRARIRQDCTLALEMMVRDLSQASNFTSATGSAVAFSSFDNNGTAQTVAFSIDGSNNLTRTVNGTAHMLVPNASSLTFAYVDNNNNPLATPVPSGNLANIRVVTPTLTMSASNETFTLSSSAFARNQSS